MNAMNEWGLAASPVAFWPIVMGPNSDFTFQVPPSGAGSSIRVLLDSIYVDAKVANQGAVAMDSAGNPNLEVCIQGSGSNFQGGPGQQCANGQSQINIILDGTPGTITITPYVVSLNGNVAAAPMTIDVAGTATGQIIKAPGGGILLPTGPGTKAGGAGGTGGGSGAGGATTSSTGTTVALVAAGVAAVAGIGYFLMR